MKQKTFKEFLEREGYPEGRTQKVWEGGARKGAEWQAKQMYSTEEVLSILNDFIGENPIDVDKWFEQFKKK
jgi:hypothetical protein